MKLNLVTNGATLAVFFDDPKDQQIIRSSKMPVSKALQMAKNRLDVDTMWPAPGQALEGL